MKFGEKLSFLRKQRGMTQIELAEKLDISRQAVSRWERGTAAPSTENLVSIGKLFNVTVDALVDESLQLQDGSTMQVAVQECEIDRGKNDNGATRLVRQLVVGCLAIAIIVLVTFFCCFKVWLINQETKDPISFDKLDRTELNDEPSSSFHMQK